MRNDETWGIDAGYIDPDDQDERELVRREAEQDVLDAAGCKRKRGVAVNVTQLDALARRPGE